MKNLIVALALSVTVLPSIAVGAYEFIPSEQSHALPAQPGHLAVETPERPNSVPAPTVPERPNSVPAPSNSTNSGSGVTLMNPLKVDSLEELLAIVLRAIVRLGTIVLTLMLIWVGFMFIKARGNPTELTVAKKALLWTIIGGLILLGAEAIGRVIQATANTL
jgi:hypothetical protein